jgi:hypothetical protein
LAFCRNGYAQNRELGNQLHGVILCHHSHFPR